MSKIDFTIEGFASRPILVDIHLPEDLSAALPLVIYAHGINGFKDWGGMDLIAESFAEAGFAFLKFNYSHNGTTPEYPTDFVDLEAYKENSYLKRQFDLKAVLDYSLSQNLDFRIDKSRISLIGHSRGGPDVLLFAAKDSRISKLISWAAVAHAQTPWQSLTPDEIASWEENGVFTRKNGRTGQDMPIGVGLYQEYKTHKAILDVEVAAKSLTIPWLIVHGDADEAVFVKAAYDYKKWQPEASVYIIEGTGHTFDRSHPWDNSKLPPASLKKVNRSIEFLREVE